MASAKNPLHLEPKELRVLHELWRHPLASRSDLAGYCGLDLSAVSRTMAGLVARGLVEEKEIGNAGPMGGRKPVKLSISRNSGLVAGLEFRSDFCDVVVADLQGEVLGGMMLPYENLADSLADKILAVADQVHHWARDKAWNIIGIGAGFPGIVNPDQGLLIRSNPLEISVPLDVASLLAGEKSLPVLVENDARCCCHAELPGDDFLYVLGEFRKNRLLHDDFTGIALGLGLVINGQVHRGVSNSAGEFRSVFYEQTQGNFQFALADEKLAKLHDSKEVQGLFAHELGRNLALLVNVLNLPRLVLGGALPELGQGFRELLSSEIIANWQYPEQGRLEVTWASVRAQAVARGAVALFLGGLYQS